MEMEKYKPVMTWMDSVPPFSLFTVKPSLRSSSVPSLSSLLGKFELYNQAVIAWWRKASKPSLGVRGFWWVAFTAVIGVTGLTCLLHPWLLTNLVPAVTFIISIIVGLRLQFIVLITCTLPPGLVSWLPLDLFHGYLGLFPYGSRLAVLFFLQAWCVSRKGPLFSALFNPLSTVIVTFFGVLYLKEKTYLGSLLGALAIILELYIVLWGKSEDYQEESTDLKLQDEHTNLSQLLIGDKAFRNSELLEPLLM
ncbi:hypothetical protein F2Q69_00060430 [Brassica cretica]|uniref:WAT1-related protein n=1 Tax=Brassica cretica TaxID=69181 RepID=A0A8S9RNF5_BRACR|nr:hypothetical protein F2Q69_00060430 [Brassica cretica]